MARFNSDFSWVSAIILREVRVTFAPSAYVVLGNFGSRNERSEQKTPNTSAEGTAPSGSSILLHALTSKLSRSYFFSLG